MVSQGRRQTRRFSFLKYFQFGSLTGRMGCVNGKPVLTEEDLEFIAQHTAITREEVDQQYENFLRKHPDGKIRKKDFRNMMQTCYPNTDTEKLEKHIFRMYDSNGDGYIDFREFMIVLYIMSNGSPEANLKQIFRIFDINGDGAITQKEMIRIVKDLFHLLDSDDKTGQATGEDLATSAFKEMDINLDGQVSQEEFLRACLGHKKISTMLALRIIDVFIADAAAQSTQQ